MIGLGRAVDLSVVCGPARHWIIFGYFKVYFIRFWTCYTGGGEGGGGGGGGGVKSSF